MVRGAPALAALFVALSLAGCADAPEPVAEVDSIPLELEVGKGAIAGLLVDDRFRPLEGGRVLLQELALTLETDANGQFTFVDLEPQSYTLRVTLAGHEAAPVRVQVEEGLFAEASLVARRIANLDGVIITEELAAFVSCNANAPVIAVYCGAAVMPDLSGDTQRWQLDVDYQQHGDAVSYWVIEMRTDKEAEKNGAVKLIVRDGGNYFVNDVITEGNYLWTSMKRNETSTNDVEDRNHPWLNDMGYLVQVWAQGLFKEETHNFPAGVITYDSRGVGIQLGLKATLLSSLFLYEPTTEVSVESYCHLC